MSYIELADLEGDLAYYGQIQEHLLGRRATQFAKLTHFRTHVFPLIEYVGRVYSEGGRTHPSLKVLAYSELLLCHEWNSVELNLASGQHFAAARTLRWMLETAIASCAGSVDGISLAQSGRTGPIPFTAFEAWLRKYDQNSRLLNRRTAMAALSFSDGEIDGEERLYRKLCKYSHPSRVSIGRIRSNSIDTVPTPNIDLFDTVYSLACGTVDYVLAANIHAVYDVLDGSEFPAYVANYRDNVFGRNIGPQARGNVTALDSSELKVTWKLVKAIADTGVPPT